MPVDHGMIFKGPDFVPKAAIQQQQKLISSSTHLRRHKDGRATASLSMAHAMERGFATSNKDGSEDDQAQTTSINKHTSARDGPSAIRHCQPTSSSPRRR